MIDKAARHSVASLTRRLACGGLTNDQFQDELFAIVASTEDKGLMKIAEHLDSLYGDLWTYRLRGKHKLSREARHWVARCILWLRTEEVDIPAEPAEAPVGPFHSWDVLIGLAGLVAAMVSMLTLGGWDVLLSLTSLVIWLGWVHQRQLRHERDTVSSWQRASHWPFSDEQAFRNARRRPVFLRGG